MNSSVDIPSAALEHFNKRSLEVLKLFQSAKAPDSRPTEPEGSIKAKTPILDLGVISEIFWSQKSGKYAVQEGGLVHGFIVKNTYDEFQDFVCLVYKRREINSRHKFETVNDVSFEWFRKAQHGFATNYSTYLLQELKVLAKDRMFFFPILFLEIEGTFSIGNVQFSYFTKEMLKAFENDGVINAEQTKFFDRKLSGQVMASIAIEGSDAKKGEQNALEACTLAVDVLKMFSSTIDDPLTSCDFGLEAKLSFNPVSSPLVMDLEMKEGRITPANLMMSLRTHAKPFVISQQHCDFMASSGLGVIHQFIISPPDNELSHLALQAIRFMGDAISNRSMHKRIIELFTIAESFLIRNENEPVLASLIKYFPKVVAKGYDDRLVIKELINKLYQVRSASIHHGKQKSFATTDLINLQNAIRILILNMIQASKKYATKHLYLTEIDKAIDAAF